MCRVDWSFEAVEGELECCFMPLTMNIWRHARSVSSACLGGMEVLDGRCGWG